MISFNYQKVRLARRLTIYSNSGFQRWNLTPFMFMDTIYKLIRIKLLIFYLNREKSNIIVAIWPNTYDLLIVTEKLKWWYEQPCISSEEEGEGQFSTLKSDPVCNYLLNLSWFKSSRTNKWLIFQRRRRESNFNVEIRSHIHVYITYIKFQDWRNDLPWILAVCSISSYLTCSQVIQVNIVSCLILNVRGIENSVLIHINQKEYFSSFVLQVTYVHVVLSACKTKLYSKSLSSLLVSRNGFGCTATYIIKILGCSHWFCKPPPSFIWGSVLLYSQSPKGGCCSISDDLSCSHNHNTDNNIYIVMG